MLGDKNDAVGRRYIGTLKDAGYDYMELPLAQIMDCLLYTSPSPRD